MTRDEAKRLAPFMQAFGEGREIEYRQPYGDQKWRSADNPCFDPGCEYRIKPEPLEIWVNVYPDGVLSCIYREQQDLPTVEGAKQVKFREVMEEI